MRPVALTLIVGLLACLTSPEGLFSAEPTAQQPTLAPPQTAGQPIEERLARLEMQLQLIQQHLGLRFRLPPATSGADTTLPDQSTDYDRIARLEREARRFEERLEQVQRKLDSAAAPSRVTPCAHSRSARCPELDRLAALPFGQQGAVLRPAGPHRHLGSVPDSGSLSSIARVTQAARHEPLAMDGPRLRNAAGDPQLTPPLRLVDQRIFICEPEMPVAISISVRKERRAMNESLFLVAMTIGVAVILPLAITIAVRPFGRREAVNSGADALATIEKIPRFTSFFEHQCWDSLEVQVATAKVAA